MAVKVATAAGIKATEVFFSYVEKGRSCFFMQVKNKPPTVVGGLFSNKVSDTYNPGNRSFAGHSCLNPSGRGIDWRLVNGFYPHDAAIFGH